MPSSTCVKPLVLSAVVLALASVACARTKPDFGTLPRVVVTMGEEPEEALPKKVPTAASNKETKVAHDAPDPPPISTTEQLDFVLRFDKGELSVVSKTPIALPLDTPSVRQVGRFSFELFVGSILLERVRFDFPLLGAGAPEGEDAWEQGLTAETKVRIPYVDRATRARILDRKTRKVLEIPWTLEREPTSISPDSRSGAAPSKPPPESQSPSASEKNAPQEDKNSISH